MLISRRTVFLSQYDGMHRAQNGQPNFCCATVGVLNSAARLCISVWEFRVPCLFAVRLVAQVLFQICSDAMLPPHTWNCDSICALYTRVWRLGGSSADVCTLNGVLAQAAVKPFLAMSSVAHCISIYLTSEDSS